MTFHIIQKLQNNISLLNLQKIGLLGLDLKKDIHIGRINIYQFQILNYSVIFGFLVLVEVKVVALF